MKKIKKGDDITIRTDPTGFRTWVTTTGACVSSTDQSIKVKIPHHPDDVRVYGAEHYEQRYPLKKVWKVNGVVVNHRLD